jgi:hypothetical protein
MFRNLVKFSLLKKVLEIFLRCGIGVQAEALDVVSPGDWLVSGT